MALFGDAKLVLCLFFAICCYMTVTQAEVPADCCLSVTNAEVIKHAIVDYRRQVAGQGCTLNATILVTRRQKQLCAPASERWVEDVVAHVKQLRKCCNKAKCRQANKKKRCLGVKAE
ncbi:unnamed protein product [Tetraodon nigroviridis]|uniref:(spotted green pufferfish) hypothetical protein n=1 Tax=Tetraodon nigroviridis TaxID=99883 RepID=Q4RUZ0_TETNG|nr:unnamed protein product [Tetraodon nigroviridis]